jgi:hypothetical protein
MCSCQKFHVSTRIVTSGHESYDCPSLVKLRKKKLACTKPSKQCQQRAIEVALDSFHHGVGDSVDGHSREAARVFRLAGGLGKSADIVASLEAARDIYETALEDNGKKGYPLETVKSASRITVQEKLKKMLPKNNVDKLMDGMHKIFTQSEGIISESHPEWTEQMCQGYMSKKTCNSPEHGSSCSWVYADATCHDAHDLECRNLRDAEECNNRDRCYFSEKSMECRYENARAFSCPRLNGKSKQCQEHNSCVYDIQSRSCEFDCSNLNAEQCMSSEMTDACEWQVDESEQHADAIEGAEEVGNCIPSQVDILENENEMHQTDDLVNRHRPAVPMPEDQIRGGNQGLDIEEEMETGGGGGAMPEHEENNPYKIRNCDNFYSKKTCNSHHTCLWTHNTCKYRDDHRVNGDRKPAATDDFPTVSDGEESQGNIGLVEEDPDGPNVQRGDFSSNQHGVRPHSAPSREDDDVDDGRHYTSSNHKKTATGDALFFTFGILAVLLLIAVAFVSACSSKKVVFGAGIVDFWTLAAFYWIDVRLPYNIDRYEFGGLDYDAFAIAVLMVVIFAMARVGSAYTSMNTKEGGPKRAEFWDRFDVLAMMGLIAQLVVLCIHVITTKHASRTVVCAFMGTITSAVVQAWHIIQDAKSKLGKQG